MENREIKELFLQADKQIAIQESRKQQVLTSMTMELKQQKIPVLNQREILFSQFLYMDKSFLILHAIAVCFCIGILLLLQRAGADINTMIIACMIGVSGIAVLTVFLIDKLFLGRMAECCSLYGNCRQHKSCNIFVDYFLHWKFSEYWYFTAWTICGDSIFSV